MPKDPPPRVARALASFLVGLGVAAGLFAVSFSVPESIRGSFVLVPEHGTDPVKAPRHGVVERMDASDGAEVRRGDVLFVIRSDELGRLSTERATLEKDVAAARERARELEAEEERRRQADRGALAELAARIARLAREDEDERALDHVLSDRYEAAHRASAEKDSALAAEASLEEEREAMARKMRERSEVAFKGGAIAEAELLRERRSATDAALEARRASRALAESRAATQELEQARRREVCERALAAARRDGEAAGARAALDRTTQESLARKEAARSQVEERRTFIATAAIRLRELARELESANGAACAPDAAACETPSAEPTPGREGQGDLLVVVAPYDGTIVNLGPRRAGALIERGELLCEIARAGEPLHAEVVVPERDVGRVASGQAVRFLLSAYPYTRYGGRSGEVVWVSPSGSSASFRIRASIEEPTVAVDGRVRPLRAGLGGEARIVVGERTLVEYALEPLRVLRENVRAR